MAGSTKKPMHPKSPPPYNPNPSQPGVAHGYPPQPQVQQVVYPQQVPSPHAHQGYIPVVPQLQPQLVAIAPVPSVGPYPARVNCPSCHNQTVTRTESVNSSKTHIWALVLCILGCWPCCLIPYCMDDCMSTNHYCAHCNTYLGRYEA